MSKRSEKRARARKLNTRKSRLSYYKATEKAWMEVYNGDKRRLRMVRKQGSIRHRPYKVRKFYKKPMLSEDDWKFMENILTGMMD